MNDRIKLAEAMGWIACEFTWQELSDMGEFCAVPPNHPDPPGAGNITALPDPENDANDDYAVLEWMRKGEHIVAFRTILQGCGSSDGYAIDYKIGDYARAALEVME